MLFQGLITLSEIICLIASIRSYEVYISLDWLESSIVIMDITRVVKGVQRANFVYCESICLANSAMGGHSRYLSICVYKSSYKILLNLHFFQARVMGATPCQNCI